MRLISFVCVTLIALSGCGRIDTQDLGQNKKVDVVFVGPKNGTSGFEKASADAQKHYDFIRAARKAQDGKDYDRAIALLNKAIPSAEFKFEKGAIYMSLIEIYSAKNDLENELKYQLLLSENTGNENLRQSALKRADEIKALLQSKEQSSPK